MAAGDNRVRRGRKVRKPADAVTGAKHLPRKSKGKGKAKGRRAGDVEIIASQNVVAAASPGPVAAPFAEARKAPENHSAQDIDKAFKAKLAQLTFGLSPAGIGSK